MRTNKLLLYLISTVVICGGATLILVTYALPGELVIGYPTEPQIPDNTYTTTDISYGLHPQNTFDLYRPISAEPTPLMIFIHGGGFVSGDKSEINKDDHAATRDSLLRAGVSVASMNYRFLDDTRIDHIMTDSSQIMLYLQNNAQSLGIDPDKIGVYGTSAGGGIALYMGLHPDTSQHIRVIGHIRSQSTYDMLQWPQILNIDVTPEINARVSPIVVALYHGDENNAITDPEITMLRQSVDLPSFMDAGDPPILLQNYDKPRQSSNPFNTDPTISQLNHSPLHAIYLSKQCVIHGITCHLNTAETPKDSRYDTAEFFIRYLTDASS